MSIFKAPWYPYKLDSVAFAICSSRAVLDEVNHPAMMKDVAGTGGDYEWVCG